MLRVNWPIMSIWWQNGSRLMRHERRSCGRLSVGVTSSGNLSHFSFLASFTSLYLMAKYKELKVFVLDSSKLNSGFFHYAACGLFLPRWRVPLCEGACLVKNRIKRATSHLLMIRILSHEWLWWLSDEPAKNEGALVDLRTNQVHYFKGRRWSALKLCPNLCRVSLAPTHFHLGKLNRFWLGWLNGNNACSVKWPPSASSCSRRQIALVRIV